MCCDWYYTYARDIFFALAKYLVTVAGSIMKRSSGKSLMSPINNILPFLNFIFEGDSKDILIVRRYIRPGSLIFFIKQAIYDRRIIDPIIPQRNPVNNDIDSHDTRSISFSVLGLCYVGGPIGPIHKYPRLGKTQTYAAFYMMTSSNVTILRVTGHLCGEFTGHRWIPA